MGSGRFAVGLTENLTDAIASIRTSANRDLAQIKDGFY